METEKSKEEHRTSDLVPHQDIILIKTDADLTRNSTKTIPEVDKIKPGSRNDPFRAYRFLKQTCIITIWISIGLYGGLIGPTLPELRDNIGVDMDEISAALMIKTVGILMGSFTAGFVYNIYYKKAELIMFFGIVGMATITLAPLGNSLPYVCFFFWTAGFGEGIVNVGGNPMVMHLWQEHAATPLLLTHFGYGFGAIISPQIARPFLSSKTDEEGSNVTTIVNVITGDIDLKYDTHRYMLLPYRWQYEGISHSTTGEEESQIILCYVIVGVLILCIALFQFYFVLKKPPQGYKIWEPDADVREMLHPSSCANGDTAFGLQMIMGLCIYYALMSGGQFAYSDFLYSYASESELKFSTDEAAAVNSAFFLCYTIGRLFGGLMAKCVPIQAIIATAILFTTTEVVILALFAEQNDAVFWTFTCMLGFTISMLFPGGMAWGNLYLYMNSMSTMVLLMGSSLGRIPFQYAAGYVYETYEPNYIFYVSGMGFIGLIVVFTVLQMRASCYGTKYKRENNEKEHDIVIKYPIYNINGYYTNQDTFTTYL